MDFSFQSDITAKYFYCFKHYFLIVDDDKDDEEVVFVSSSPAVIASSDSDDDIMVISHTTSKKRSAPSLSRSASTPSTMASRGQWGSNLPGVITPDVQTDRAVSSIFDMIDKDMNSLPDTSVVTLDSSTTSNQCDTCPSDQQQSQDSNDVDKAIRSIAMELQSSETKDCKPSTSDLDQSSFTLNSILPNDFLSSQDTLSPFTDNSVTDPWKSNQTSSDPWLRTSSSLSNDNSKSSLTLPSLQPSQSASASGPATKESKSGGIGVKSSLKRSSSIGCCSSSVPLKKRPLFSLTSSGCDSDGEAAGGASEDMICMTCLSTFPAAKLSRCLLGHSSCSACLQKRVKKILASGEKVT